MAKLTPEPCLRGGPCRAPRACNDWGYCRERNMDDQEAPLPEQIKVRREIAAGRAALAEHDGREG